MENIHAREVSIFCLFNHFYNVKYPSFVSDIDTFLQIFSGRNKYVKKYIYLHTLFRILRPPPPSPINHHFVKEAQDVQRKWKVKENGLKSGNFFNIKKEKKGGGMTISS